MVLIEFLLVLKATFTLLGYCYFKYNHNFLLDKFATIYNNIKIYH